MYLIPYSSLVLVDPLDHGDLVHHVFDVDQGSGGHLECVEELVICFA